MTDVDGTVRSTRVFPELCGADYSVEFCACGVFRTEMHSVDLVELEKLKLRDNNDDNQTERFFPLRMRE